MNAVNIGLSCFPFACTINQLELTQTDRKKDEGDGEQDKGEELYISLKG